MINQGTMGPISNEALIGENCKSIEEQYKGIEIKMGSFENPQGPQVESQQIQESFNNANEN